MTIEVQVFCPNTAYIISASTTTANQALTQPPNVSGAAGNSNGYNNLRVYNANASKMAFFQVGMTSQTATTASIYQVPPNTSMSFEMTAPYTNLGVILDSGASASNFYVMLGTE